MIRRSNNVSESWKNLPWKKFRRNLFRLQKRVYKAVQVGDMRKAKSIQKLILKSTAARLLAVRQVTQLNNVQGEKSPYDGNLTYWSKRNSKLYDGETSKALQRQNHTCAACGLKLLSDERVHLHHVDGNHANWKKQNLIATHESCHDYLHMGKRES